jgi:tellurite resistance protein
MSQIPDRVPSAKVKSIALLDCEIVRWEESLNAVREDSQLGQIDLQNALQKTQQILQELSNLSKTTHDTAMSIIRNMRG